MNCYFCAPHHPGGTDFGNCSAIGICYRCGVGVCPEHGQKKPHQARCCSVLSVPNLCRRTKKQVKPRRKYPIPKSV
jgi:hypothetical protein